ncbi:Signal transduction histidine kinase [Noviherbaspirillum humi]|uniref:histidine kinase n=1 Tax=Noviherbaspirillum humi TaxID=1688639 RepID=A0A239FM00_9BURK|nr:hybrid sensor histidine kinase/response regulator [Noviherbaspirillum humi]SNS57910.1 Signal transduction histidine kinase [Noviherbaspirillum humi]
MPHLIRLLHVDDNPDDRILVQRALAPRFPDMDYIGVGTAADYARHIDTHLDCVITDYRIGWTDGLAVLRDVRQRHPEVPILMFTNTGSEEVCAAGMKAGLSDYIVKRKEEFPRLPALVATAMELSQARQALLERDRQLRELLEREQFARAEAVRANHLKDEFLATVSHELRTPLSAILGWVHLLQLQKLPRERELEGFRIIERNAHAQVKLIEDLLDLSRIISGTLRIDLGPLDLLDAVNKAVDSFRAAAGEKSISLSTRFDPAPPLIRGDAQRIEQIVANLLANAIKFTPEAGAVTVSLRRVGSHVEIAVADNGVGIDQGFVPHLFDRFRQSDAGPTRRHGGLGIGLSVAKNLVELHGGSLTAQSEGIGKGACFTVRFPVAVMRESVLQQAEASAGDEAAQRLKGLRILVIDDDQDTLDIVQRILAMYGAQVNGALRATHGLESLAQQDYDVLLSDIGMPDMDGFTMIEQVRRTDHRNRDIPAAAVTAFARSQDRERALLAGFDAYLVKPIEPGELIAVVLSLVKRRRSDKA